MISKNEEDIERWASEGGYIGKDQLTGVVSIESEEPVSEDLLEKMRQAIRKLDDAELPERIRKLEAVRNEHEVQERARAYREKGLTPPEDRLTCPHCGGAITPPSYEVD